MMMIRGERLFHVRLSAVFCWCVPADRDDLEVFTFAVVFSAHARDCEVLGLCRQVYFSEIESDMSKQGWQSFFFNKKFVLFKFCQNLL